MNIIYSILNGIIKVLLNNSIRWLFYFIALFLTVIAFINEPIRFSGRDALRSKKCRLYAAKEGQEVQKKMIALAENSLLFKKENNNQFSVQFRENFISNLSSKIKDEGHEDAPGMVRYILGKEILQPFANIKEEVIYTIESVYLI